MLFTALLIVGLLISVGAAATEVNLPWKPAITTSEKVAEGGIIAFLIGLAYLLVGRAPSDTSAWGWAGFTMMLLGAVVGAVGFVYIYSSREMMQTAAVTTARRNRNRGPRSYAATTRKKDDGPVVPIITYIPS